MSTSTRGPAFAPVLTAGTLLAVHRDAVLGGLVMPSIDQIVRAMGASRSRVYEIKRDVVAFLPTLDRPPGRPRVAAAPADASKLAELLELASETVCFMARHPGCMQSGERARYSDHYRRFVLELHEQHADVTLSELAKVTALPLGTLEDWVRCAHPAIEPDAAPTSEEPRAVTRDARQAQIETVLAAWDAWHGDFSSFCEHVRRDHRLELGRTLIANILFAHGERKPARRSGRSRDEHALRGAFVTFFPGAQWVGDGKQLEVGLDGRAFRFNLELDIDAATGAAVGISVRDEEDSTAVTEAFAHGVQTTGAPPLALLLDNRSSNHVPEVDAALGDTMRIRATLRRAQNKAHVEGGFGLFAQKVPPIELDTRDPRTHAKAIVQLIATTFCRALNRAPRRDRGGKTRVELYAQPVTPEQREAARAALRERMHKQELARQTRAARLDPTMAALLDDAFARLGLLDPDRHVRDVIACYPRDAVVDAIAIFGGKRTAGTLPDGVDARYLLGIVRNVHHRHEAEPITEALIRERLAARDRFLAPLVLERDAILAADRDVGAKLVELVDRLVRAERAIDQHVWLDAAAALVAPCEHDERVALAKRAARRVHAAFHLATRDRDRLERALLRRLWPLE